MCSLLVIESCSISVGMFCVNLSFAPTGFYAVFFLMIRRPPRSTLDRSSAASDVYKRQMLSWPMRQRMNGLSLPLIVVISFVCTVRTRTTQAVSYTHLRAHETVLDIVCRLLLEKKNKSHKMIPFSTHHTTCSRAAHLAYLL